MAKKKVARKAASGPAAKAVKKAIQKSATNSAANRTTQKSAHNVAGKAARKSYAVMTSKGATKNTTKTAKKVLTKSPTKPISRTTKKAAEPVAKKPVSSAKSTPPMELTLERETILNDLIVRAVVDGDLATVQSSVKELGRRYYTALASSLLMLAVKRDQPACIEFLMKKASWHYQALKLAAKLGHLNALEAVAPVAKRGRPDKGRWKHLNFLQALSLAAMGGNTKCIAYLLTHSDLRLRTDSAIFVAARDGKIESLDQLLSYNLHDKAHISGSFVSLVRTMTADVARLLVPHVDESAIKEVMAGSHINQNVSVALAIRAYQDERALSDVLANVGAEDRPSRRRGRGVI